LAKLAKTSRPSRPAKPAVEGFWDKPPLLNLAADVLFLAAGTALVYAAALGVQRLPFFPLREVVVQGTLDQVTRTQIEYAARSAVTGNFFTVDLDAVRTSFEKLPWVRRAEVRRRWPDGLLLTIEEQSAVARWRQAGGEYKLVNRQGEVFVAATEAALPVFAGPEGSADEVLAQHREFSAALAPISRGVVEIVLSQREAWQLKLDDGLVLNLGRNDERHPVAERMRRFVSVYAQVGEKLHLHPTLIDMRYPSGFAVRSAGAMQSS